MIPRFSRKVRNMTFPKGIVRISVTCSSVPMIEPYRALLYHIPNKVVPAINMLGSIVEPGIL